MEENNANHDIQDPQDRYNVLQRKTWILNQGRLYLFTPCRRGHDAPLFWHLQQHHQADQSMVQQQDDPLPAYTIRATHKELLQYHDNVWELFLSASTRGTLFLIVFYYVPVLLAPIPTLWYYCAW